MLLIITVIALLDDRKVYLSVSSTSNCRCSSYTNMCTYTRGRGGLGREIQTSE